MGRALTLPCWQGAHTALSLECSFKAMLLRIHPSVTCLRNIWVFIKNLDCLISSRTHWFPICWQSPGGCDGAETLQYLAAFLENWTIDLLYFNMWDFWHHPFKKLHEPELSKTTLVTSLPIINQNYKILELMSEVKRFCLRRPLKHFFGMQILSLTQRLGRQVLSQGVRCTLKLKDHCSKLMLLKLHWEFEFCEELQKM